MAAITYPLAGSYFISSNLADGLPDHSDLRDGGLVIHQPSASPPSASSWQWKYASWPPLTSGAGIL